MTDDPRTKLAFVIFHQGCPSVPADQQPPKFAIVDFSATCEQIRLQCAVCGLELTLTCHTPDNPATALSKGLPDGAERPHESPPA